MNIDLIFQVNTDITLWLLQLCLLVFYYYKKWGETASFSYHPCTDDVWLLLACNKELLEKLYCVKLGIWPALGCISQVTDFQLPRKASPGVRWVVRVEILTSCSGSKVSVWNRWMEEPQVKAIHTPAPECTMWLTLLPGSLWAWKLYSPERGRETESQYSGSSPSSVIVITMSTWG